MRHAPILAVPAIILGVVAYAQTAPSDVTFSEYGEIAESLTGTPGDAAAGREIMTGKGAGNCIACHAAADYADVPFAGNVGPALDGVADRWDEAGLRGIVANAKMTFPDTIMPAFYHTGPYVRPGDAFTGKAPEGDLPPMLSAQEVEDVVAYLMTLHE